MKLIGHLSWPEFIYFFYQNALTLNYNDSLRVSRVSNIVKKNCKKKIGGRDQRKKKIFSKLFLSEKADFKIEYLQLYDNHFKAIKMHLFSFLVFEICETLKIS